LSPTELVTRDEDGGDEEDDDEDGETSTLSFSRSVLSFALLVDMTMTALQIVGY
jgi:hypothetical protein